MHKVRFRECWLSVDVGCLLMLVVHLACLGLHLLKYLIVEISFVVVGVFSDGDVSVHEDVLENYMKQKHRLIWERRKRERDSREAVMPMD